MGTLPLIKESEEFGDVAGSDALRDLSVIGDPALILRLKT